MHAAHHFSDRLVMLKEGSILLHRHIADDFQKSKDLIRRSIPERCGLRLTMSQNLRVGIFIIVTLAVLGLAVFLTSAAGSRCSERVIR